ncbi:hypothetical protein ACE38V_01075 [Cytobacillus sp. Hz8]|uniref:hypothetical protein n=1 Tax=Cytobacillus sp. Hz8 TaxID=3347168 RepID=UPI0035DA07E3
MMDQLLSRSLKENIPLEMIYLSTRGQISQRRIWVKEVKGNYVRAFCTLRQQTRLFKIDHILSVMPVKGYRKQIS